MKISELISYLQGVYSEHGDIHVWGDDKEICRISVDWFSFEALPDSRHTALFFCFENRERKLLLLQKQRREAAEKEALTKPKKSKKGGKA